METISSSSTPLTKWVPSTVWFVMSALFGIAGVVLYVTQGKPQGLWVTLGAVVAMVMGYYLAAATFWSLADEVLDCGTYLRVRRGSVTEHIELTHITDVTYIYGKITRCYLRLSRPCAFGVLVRFVPRSNGWFSLSCPEVVEDLAGRVEDLRQQRLAAFRAAAMQQPGGAGPQGP